MVDRITGRYPGVTKLPSGFTSGTTEGHSWGTVVMQLAAKNKKVKTETDFI